MLEDLGEGDVEPWEGVRRTLGRERLPCSVTLQPDHHSN